MLLFQICFFFAVYFLKLSASTGFDTVKNEQLDVMLMKT